jgi:3-oxoadipate enol-lactonase
MITRDGRFAYETAGDPGAIPLIFLHGIGGAARAWRQQLATFGNRFRAIAWDMPGYGGSAPLASVSIAALADALQQFIEQIGAAKPILVGHSIGGMIVQKWLVQSPKLARAVTELVGDDPDTKGMELARECMASVPEASYRAMMLALIGFDQRSTLKDISVPTLLLSGSKDNNAPAPMMAKTATYIPAAEYVELPGVGHLANLERPDAFDKALGGFVDPFAAKHG